MDGEDDGAEIVAGRAAAHWHETTRVLSAFFGERAIASVYRRALKLASRAHPFLAQAQETSHPLTFSNLRITLAEQSPVNATAAFNASVTAFNTVVDSLIGPDLTLRLLAGSNPVLATSTVAERHNAHVDQRVPGQHCN